MIHAGLYYGTSSLKAELCLRGKSLLYSLCTSQQVPHARIGKLIVAQDSSQYAALESLHATAQSLSIPTTFLSSSQVSSREPHVRAAAGALHSPTTGIVDSHALMAHLHASFESSGGDTALSSTVEYCAPSPSGGWDLTLLGPDGERSSFSAEVLVNAAGLAAVDLSNSILPQSRRITPHFAKGSYYSYAGRAPASTLIYPAPKEGLGGLGTHLTLDLQGRARFGPDVQWVDTPDDLVPTDDAERRKAAVKEIREYFPEVEEGRLEIDYCGIRPKLVGKDGGGGKDFYIKKEEGLEGFINLLGIESPGLTSSLGIAEYVHDMLYR